MLNYKSLPVVINSNQAVNGHNNLATINMQSRFHNNAIIASPNTVALVHPPVSVAAGRVQRGRERELLASCVGVCVCYLWWGRPSPGQQQYSSRHYIHSSSSHHHHHQQQQHPARHTASPPTLNTTKTKAGNLNLYRFTTQKAHKIKFRIISVYKIIFFCKIVLILHQFFINLSTTRLSDSGLKKRLASQCFLVL